MSEEEGRHILYLEVRNILTTLCSNDEPVGKRFIYTKTEPKFKRIEILKKLTLVILLIILTNIPRIKVKTRTVNYICESFRSTVGASNLQ